MDTHIGHVSTIYTTPTKGFGVHPVQQAHVTRTGIVGNREFFLVDVDEILYSVPKDPIFLDHWTSYDPNNGIFTLGRGTHVLCAAPVHPAPIRQFKFDDRVVEGFWAPGPWDNILSRLAGRRIRLARCNDPGGGYDVHPVTVVSTASLGALGHELDGAAMDPRRFRLNLTLELGPTPFIEDTLRNRTIRIGEVCLKIGDGVPRCLAVEHRPKDGDRSLQVQRRIRELRGPTATDAGPAVLFGIYAQVSVAGTLQVGDGVDIADFTSATV